MMIIDDYHLIDYSTFSTFFKFKAADHFLGMFFMVEEIFKRIWMSEKLFEYNRVIYFNPDKPRLGWL